MPWPKWHRPRAGLTMVRSCTWFQSRNSISAPKICCLSSSPRDQSSSHGFLQTQPQGVKELHQRTVTVLASPRDPLTQTQQPQQQFFAPIGLGQLDHNTSNNWNVPRKCLEEICFFVFSSLFLKEKMLYPILWQ